MYPSRLCYTRDTIIIFQDELLTMVKYGVVGFKCFLCPSGVDEFNAVSMGDVERALQILENCDTVLAVSTSSYNYYDLLHT